MKKTLISIALGVVVTTAGAMTPVPPKIHVTVKHIATDAVPVSLTNKAHAKNAVSHKAHAKNTPELKK